MRKVNFYEQNDFNEKSFNQFFDPLFSLLQDPEFQLQGAHELPVHSHDLEGQVNPVVIEGEGKFLSKGWKYRFPRRQRMY